MIVDRVELNDKQKGAALDGALTQIERQFGKGTIMRMGDDGARQKIGAIPTGVLSLDLALGIGGVPKGRIVEIYGPESSGKTTLVYEIIAQAQKTGGGCAVIGTEHAIDPGHARRVRVDIAGMVGSPADHRRRGAG